jgi:hypothetical protein
LARLAADIWVSAYLTRLRLADIPVFVVKKGDATAGAVMVKLNTLDGQAIAYQRQFDLMADRREWVELASGDERDVDAALSNKAGTILIYGSSKLKIETGARCLTKLVSRIDASLSSLHGGLSIFTTKNTGAARD